MKTRYTLTLILTFVLVTISYFISLQNVHAEDLDSTSQLVKTKYEHILYDKEKGAYFDTRDNGYLPEVVYQVSGGKIIKEVPIEEYLEMAEEDPTKNEFQESVVKLTDKTDTSISPLAGPVVYYRYTESSNVQTRIYGERASKIVENPTSSTVRHAISYSTSYSHEFNVSLGTEAKNAVIASVSYTWVSSASVSETVEMDIPPGYWGYWRFDPLVRKSQGVLKKYNDGFVVSEQNVRVLYPVKRNGQLDGYLVPVQGKL